MRNKVLFILNLPPPIHGAAVIGSFIQKSALINRQLECEYINLTTSTHYDNIGKGSFQKILKFLSLYFKVLKTIALRRYDLYYLTINSKGNGFYKDYIIVILLKVFCCKIAYHFHNKGVSEGQNKWLLNLMYRFQFNNSSAILLSSLLYYDIAKYIPRDRVYYCANGIPEISNINWEEINRKKEKRLIPNVLFLSNMMREKGVFTLLESCKLLYSKGIKFNMIFAGAWIDVEESEFSDFIKLNNLGSNIFYKGSKTGKEKSNYFESGDIFILPSHNEAFGLVLLEAMQFGLPTIATREGGIPDIVLENKSGFLVQKQNVIDLADKLQFLIENPTARKEFGAEGKRLYEASFKLEIFEKKFLSTLKDIIQKQ
jgi:Glycosyltransferase